MAGRPVRSRPVGGVASTPETRRRETKGSDMKEGFGRIGQAIPAVILFLCLVAAPSAASTATPTCRSGFGRGERERAAQRRHAQGDGRQGRDRGPGRQRCDPRPRPRRHACGGRGDDLLEGPGIISGGRGDDVLRRSGAEWGNRGNDRLYGFKGGDNDFTPGPGNDLVVGAARPTSSISRPPSGRSPRASSPGPPAGRAPTP
jgi:hypothetical protein